MLLGCAAGRCPATTILGLSLYRSHATDLEKPQIRRSRRWFGRQSHRRHSFAASTSAAPATCCTVSASQFPIEPAEPAAPIPRLPSLAAFERRPRCAWQRSRWAGIRNPSQNHAFYESSGHVRCSSDFGTNAGKSGTSVQCHKQANAARHGGASSSARRRNPPQNVPENAGLHLKRSRAVVLVVSRSHHDNEIKLRDDADRLPASTKRASPVDLTAIGQRPP